MEGRNNNLSLILRKKAGSLSVSVFFLDVVCVSVFSSLKSLNAIYGSDPRAFSLRENEKIHY